MLFDAQLVGPTEVMAQNRILVRSYPVPQMLGPTPKHRFMFMAYFAEVLFLPKDSPDPAHAQGRLPLRGCLPLLRCAPCAVGPAQLQSPQFLGRPADSHVTFCVEENRVPPKSVPAFYRRNGLIFIIIIVKIIIIIIIIIIISIIIIIHIYILITTSSTAQGGGGSFKDRKTIGEVGSCESWMAERTD